MMSFPRILLTAILAGFLGSASAAPLSLNPLFTDHGVLQQELPVPVWGQGNPGQKVVVTFGEQSVETKVDESGRWIATLTPLGVSREPAEMTVKSGSDTLAVKDLLVGEVWVCSGQSNMAQAVSNSTTAAEAGALAESGKLSHLRLFKVAPQDSNMPATTVNAAWSTATPESVRAFSATGFYFGAALTRDRDVPVGLIQSAIGGTNANSWINTGTYVNEPEGEMSRVWFEQIVEKHPAALERYETQKAAWAEKSQAAKAAGKPLKGRAPREPIGPGHPKRPTAYYHGMISPLQPYAMRGVIWYQGEANSRMPFAPAYRDLMFALVEDWRSDWAAAAGLDVEKRQDFPFYLVQLPNFGGGHPRGWPLIREQMLKFWQEGENTGMITSIDVGDAKDIHPRNKKPVGERLARFARANTYGEDIAYSGPIYDSMMVEDGKVALRFLYAGGGLQSADEQPLRHFEVAGGDGEFVPATAVSIEGDTVVVSADSIPEPRAVRYAWSSNPEGINFFNAEGLPASPFRTDTWEIILDPAPVASTPKPATEVTAEPESAPTPAAQ